MVVILQVQERELMEVSTVKTGLGMAARQIRAALVVAAMLVVGTKVVTALDLTVETGSTASAMMVEIVVLAKTEADLEIV